MRTTASACEAKANKTYRQFYRQSIFPAVTISDLPGWRRRFNSVPGHHIPKHLTQSHVALSVRSQSALVRRMAQIRNEDCSHWALCPACTARDIDARRTNSRQFPVLANRPEVIDDKCVSRHSSSFVGIICRMSDQLVQSRKQNLQNGRLVRLSVAEDQVDSWHISLQRAARYRRWEKVLCVSR